MRGFANLSLNLSTTSHAILTITKFNGNLAENICRAQFYFVILEEKAIFLINKVSSGD
jgi:hypothetical protein